MHLLSSTGAHDVLEEDGLINLVYRHIRQGAQKLERKRIVFIIGYSGSLIPVLDRILGEIAGEYNLEYKILSPYKTRSIDQSLILAADLLFIYAPKLPDSLEKLLGEARGRAKIIAVDENHVELNNIDPSIRSLAAKYLKYGGENNLRSLVKLLLSILGYNTSFNEPEKIPWHGIYHPRLGVFENLEEYLSKYEYNDRPLVGILFYRSDWLYNRTIIVDLLVEKLESKGLGVIPVFTYGFRDIFLGSPHSEDSINSFFFKDGKPVIDVLVNLTSFYIVDHGRSKQWSKYEVSRGIEVLAKLGVPIVQGVIMYSKSVDEWLEDERGVDYMTLVYRVAMPEVDGIIEPVVVAGSKIEEPGYKALVPVKEHLDYIARRALRWVKLRRKKPWEKRIAIILINPPCKGLEANIAVGLGLDVPTSIARLLHRLRKEGYYVGDKIPASGDELVKLFLEKKAISEFRWTSIEEILARGGVLGHVSAEQYLEWFYELPEKIRNEMIRVWGDPRKLFEKSRNRSLAGMIYDGKIIVPGLRFGNIVVLLQPKRGCAGSRCDGRVCKILHDPKIPPPHQWLAVYRWLTRVFEADAIIHFGTHGYMEFLPGKHIGLSWSCWPEISLDDVPHIYVYVVSNPMEGVMAKRRGYAVIVDHLYPVMARPRVLDELSSLLNQYLNAEAVGDTERANILLEQILSVAKKNDIRVPDNISGKQVIEYLHKYIHLIDNSHINLGLHVFGDPPHKPQKVADYVLAIIDGTHGSPTKALAEYIGLNYEELEEKPLEYNRVYRIPNRELLEKIRDAVRIILIKLLENKANRSEILDIVKQCIRQLLGRDITINKELEKRVIEAFSKTLRVADLIAESSRETSSLLKALEGKYIEPGPSGPLTRGRIDVLPTGRNFYLIDPRILPTRAAWIIGKKTVEKLLEYYKSKHGRYPETIGEILWSIDAYKADGEMLAQILYLLGVEPVWGDNGVVEDIRVIPLEELGRPRIDVVVRISGIVRDTLPNYIELIDKAVAKVIELDEPLDKNYVKKHYLETFRKLVESGVEKDRAREQARYRVFGAPPGAYGAGVNLAVEASAWNNSEDLAKIWIQWSGYAYTSTKHGDPAHQVLVHNLLHVDLVNRNHVSDEHNILNCCCYFAYHGGFYNTVKTLGRKDVEILVTDTRTPFKANVYSIKMEIERSVRTRLLNKQWIDEMKKHGYRGASEFQRKILHLYGWASTTRMVDDWMFNEIAKKYVLDEEMRQWFIKHNVYALEEITRRLIEAAVRKLWNPPRKLLEKLREIYSEIEGVLEDEILVPSDIQGGNIEIITYDQVGEWSNNLKEINKIIESIKRKRAYGKT